MGIVRWTAKGMQLAGQILDSEDAEKWVMAKGQSLIEQKLTTLSETWWFGTSRAHRQVRAEILGNINSNKVLRTTVESKLLELPSIVEQAAQEVWSNGPSGASINNLDFKVTICPREMVIQRYTKHVVSSLKGTALLMQYQDLPEQFLAKSSQLSEASYFAQAKRPDIGLRCRVLGTDAQFDWDLGSTPGHYYVGSVFLRGDDLSKKARARDFTEFSRDAESKIDVHLGSLTPNDLAALRAAMLKLL